MVCASEEGALSLKHLAARSVSVFGSVPRVWGNPDTLLESIVTCGGSANDLVDLCLENGVDCLICGEVKYHVALEARQSGLSIIELGHDVSELPLCALLATEALAAGLRIHVSWLLINRRIGIPLKPFANSDSPHTR